MPHQIKYVLLTLLSFVLLGQLAVAQEQPSSSKWGANDTLVVPAIIYMGESMPYMELEMVYVSNLPPEKLAKAIAKYNRLRNAVYVTYPYARAAGVTMNQVNEKLAVLPNKQEKKQYIKTREKELKEQFADPLSNLSVYQGKVLMKLINRQTGNNCFEIIKEYRGSINARLYQTIAFFFGSSLKQEYDLTSSNDKQIETIVKEIDGVWYQNPYKPGIKSN
jgi:hypothetical protein